MFEYIRKNDISMIVFDQFQTKVDESVFTLDMTDWKDFHGDTKEDIPLVMPEPLGKSAHMTRFVDANHAGKIFTWH